MTTDEVKNLIEKGLDVQEIRVTGDGSMFDVMVVSEQFEGLTPVKKQQLVYGTIKPQISRGDIHALTIKAFTPAEWSTASKLQIG